MYVFSGQKNYFVLVPTVGHALNRETMPLRERFNVHGYGFILKNCQMPFSWNICLCKRMFNADSTFRRCVKLLK